MKKITPCWSAANFIEGHLSQSCLFICDSTRNLNRDQIDFHLLNLHFLFLNCLREVNLTTSVLEAIYKKIYVELKAS